MSMKHERVRPPRQECLACGLVHGDELIHQNFMLRYFIRKMDQRKAERDKQTLEAW